MFLNLSDPMIVGYVLIDGPIPHSSSAKYPKDKWKTLSVISLTRHRPEALQTNSFRYSQLYGNVIHKSLNDISFQPCSFFRTLPAVCPSPFHKRTSILLIASDRHNFTHSRTFTHYIRKWELSIVLSVRPRVP